eukprot:1134867-Pelagomonas_calceolata.AAC.2
MSFPYPHAMQARWLDARRSLDNTGCKEILVECNVLGGLASWRHDMTWVLGLSKLEHWRCMHAETFLLGGLVCMHGIQDNRKH